MNRSALTLAAFLAVTFAAAGVGSLFTASSVGSWYATVAKPSWTPPNWVFGPAWTVLYSLMAIAAWLVWRRVGLSGASVALGLYFAQLGLNVAWSGLFFGLRNIGAALVDIVGLWLLILFTTRAFWRRSHAASILLLPYLAWASFAAALNLAIWRLN